MLTYDVASHTVDRGMQVHSGKKLMAADGRPFNVRIPTYDTEGNPVPGRYKTADSTGAFLVGELERLDLRLHEPLAAVTWGRDIDLREDVTIANEVSSFTLSTYASAGGTGFGSPTINGGKAWIGKDTTQVTGISVDLAKVPHPLRPWAMELKYTILELESAALVGRPIDQQKFFGMQLKHQMDIDGQVYTGDPDFGDVGFINADYAAANSGQVTNYATAPVGAQAQTYWTTKTPDEILNDVNVLLTSTWAASGYAFPPDRLLIPPSNYSYISTIKVSEAGNVSILRYLLENNLLTSSGTARLRIFPLKWLIGAGHGGTLGTANPNRMVAYTKDPERVRYPMTLLNRTPIQYDGIYHKCVFRNCTIRTDIGEIPIHQVRRDNLVMTRNGFKPVLAAWMSGADRAVLKFRTASGKELIGTWNHPIARPDGNWIPMGLLRTGDLVVTENSAAGELITEISPCGKADVYDLTVADEHEFFASGVLVHNSTYFCRLGVSEIVYPETIGYLDGIADNAIADVANMITTDGDPRSWKIDWKSRVIL